MAIGLSLALGHLRSVVAGDAKPPEKKAEKKAEKPPEKKADEKQDEKQAEALAKELHEKFKKLQAEAKAHAKAWKLDALKEDLADAAGLYNEAENDDDLRVDIIKFVGSMTSGSKDVPLATAMLQTLADIGDVRGARYIRPYLRQRDAKEAPEMLHVAVAVAGEVPDESLVNPLLTLVTKSKTMGIVGSAVDSLARFKHASRKYRNKIVDTLLKATKRCKPGGKPRMRGLPETPADGGGYGDESGGTLGQGGGAVARWGVLSGRVPRALNDLTGQDLGGVDAWLGVLKGYKGKYDSLFQDD